jgi:hypothetical protein
LAQPSSVSSGSVNEWASRSDDSRAKGSAGPMKTMPAARSGCSAPSSSAQVAPSDRATSTARSVPVASMTVSASAVNSAGRYASAPAGRSERPLPRPSKVTTRCRRARSGTWSFQCLEWMIDQVGSSMTVGSPLPNTS